MMTQSLGMLNSCELGGSSWMAPRSLLEPFSEGSKQSPALWFRLGLSKGPGKGSTELLHSMWIERTPDPGWTSTADSWGAVTPCPQEHPAPTPLARARATASRRLQLSLLVHAPPPHPSVSLPILWAIETAHLSFLPSPLSGEARDCSKCPCSQVCTFTVLRVQTGGWKPQELLGLWEELLETSTPWGFFGHLRAIASTGSERVGHQTTPEKDSAS